MKYKDGYIIDYDMLHQMTVAEIEDTLIRISTDSYLSEDARGELTQEYLGCRKRKLDDTFVYTEENVRLMKQANELVKRQTTEVMHLAHQIFQDETAFRRQNPDGYNSLEVTAELLIPRNGYDDGAECVAGVETERDDMLWNILASPDRNNSLNTFGMLCCDAVFTSESNDVQRKIIETLYGFTEKGEVDTVSWISFRDEAVRERLKDTCFVRPFHNLYDFCAFSMQDILKIKQFKPNIEILYENI